MSKNNQKTKAKGSVGLKVLTTALVLSTIAGAAAVCLTNENVRTTLGIGSEPLQSEKPAENNNSTNSSELQVQIDKLIDEKAEDLASIKLLESEKANIQSELDSYKASLDSEKELTAEQSLHIAELESAIAGKENQISILNESVAEKDAQINQLQSIINDLQNRVDVLEEQIGTVHNSVLERVNTYEMKYDTHSIENVFKKDNYIILSSNYSIELLDTETNEYTVLFSSESSTYKYIYDIGGDVYVWGSIGLYKLDFNNKELIQIHNGYNGTYACPTSALIKTIQYDDGRILIETQSSITLLYPDNTIETYYKYIAREVNGESYYVLPTTPGTSTGRCIKKLTTDGVFEDIYNFTETNIYSIYDISIHDNLLFIQYNYQRSNNTSFATMKTVNMDTNEENILISSAQTASYQYTHVDFGDKILFYYNSYCYIYNKTDSSFTQVSLLSGTGTSLIIVDGYVFTVSMTAVLNMETCKFQATTTANSNSVTPIVNNGIIYRSNNTTLQYFDKDTLSFIDVGYELSDYSGCCGNIQNINGKLFCSKSSSTSVAESSGVFYIDDSNIPTIRKVADSNNGEFLNDRGYNYTKSFVVDDSNVLFAGFGYSILVNTDTMTTIEVYAEVSSSNNTYEDDKNIIFAGDNYIRVFDKLNKAIRTVYSKESLSALNKIYTTGSKIYFASEGANTTVCFDLDTNSIINYYGAGALIDLAGIKMGSHSASATLFDPTTGDIMNIKSYNSSATLLPVKETEDSVIFIIKTIVYEVMK